MTTDHDLDAIAARARTELCETVETVGPGFGPVLRRSRTHRRVRSGLLALVVLAALAAPVALRSDESSTVVTGQTDEPSPSTATSTSKPSVPLPMADLLAPGETRSLSPSPLVGRSTMASVWTGQELLLWGGDSEDEPFDDGAAYDPRTDTWTLLPDGPLSPRNAPAAVWTGTELLLWGGHGTREGQSDGAAYDPAARRWRPIADAPFRSEGRPVGLWTGSEMVVLAGFNSPDAAAYDPVSDRWRKLPDLPGNLQPPNTTGVWTGEEAVTVIQSGASGTELVSLRLDGAQWTSLGALPSASAQLAWTGDELLVAAGDEAFVVRDGERTPVATAPAGVQVGDATGVWTGRALVLWRGDLASAIDPVAGTWEAIPSGAATHRVQPAVVWADGVVLGWGGFPDIGTGAMLRPPD